MTSKTHQSLPYTPEWLAQRIDHFIARKNRKQSGQFIINNKNIYILPTKAGWLYSASIMAILSGAINYSNSLAYLLCFFLASLGFIVMIMTHRNLKNIIVTSKASAAVFAGKIAHYKFSAMAADNKPHYAVSYSDTDFSLLPQENTEILIPEITRKRGLQEISRFKIFTEFPLGLFHAWTQVNIDNAVIVYPSPESSPLSSSDDSTSNHTNNISKGNDEFAGVREFIKGDSIKKLAWKTIAKTGQLYTKEFHTENSKNLVFDFDKIPEQDTERKLSILCGLIRQAEEKQLNYSLKLPQRYLPLGHGEKHFHQCLTALALYE